MTGRPSLCSSVPFTLCFTNFSSLPVRSAVRSVRYRVLWQMNIHLEHSFVGFFLVYRVNSDEPLSRLTIRKFNTPSGLDLSPTNSRTIWKCLRENTEIELFSFSKILFFRRLLFIAISLFNDSSGKYSFKIVQFSSLNFSSLGKN